MTPTIEQSFVRQFEHGEAFEAACANEFAYNMALFMAGLWSLTGQVPVTVERLPAAAVA